MPKMFDVTSDRERQAIGRHGVAGEIANDNLRRENGAAVYLTAAPPEWLKMSTTAAAGSVANFSVTIHLAMTFDQRRGPDVQRQAI
jgi:hypothetical protein